ncbi:Uncharacterised protein [Bordetella pertussis]|nr:Uncharacterised protein [Bordetella pertussis]CFW49308.1 Uncharacterised protein [Bordetella pertussis]
MSSRYENGMEASRCPMVMVPEDLILSSRPSAWAGALAATPTSAAKNTVLIFILLSPVGRLRLCRPRSGDGAPVLNARLSGRTA